MQFIWAILVSSAILGSAYALLGLSFTLAFNATKVFNFAVGQLAVMGGLLLFSFSGARLNAVIAAVCAVLAMGAVGSVIYLGALRWVDRRTSEPLTMVVITLGIAEIISNGSVPIWGGSALVAPLVINGTLSIGGVTAPTQGILLVGITLLTVVVVWLVQRHTLPGKAFVALGQDRHAAHLFGVADLHVVTVAWLLGGVVAGLVGVLYLPLSSISMPNALTLGVDGFAAAMIGGARSAPGAVIAGFLLAVVGATVGVYIGSQFADVITYAILLIFLVVRPTGIFGGGAELADARA